MKAKIERYARGEFGSDIPKVSISREYIQLKIEAGTLYTGDISVWSENDCIIKGMVYDDNYILDINEHTFIEKKHSIVFAFDGTKKEKGKSYNGNIYIITDGGEFVVPYSIEIIAPYVSTVDGHIDNMFDFATLAENNWSEALRLFESEEFVRTFLCNQLVYEKVYNTLSLSLSANQALEEFLVYIHKKRAVSIGVYHNDFKYNYPKMVESHTLTISKNTWGYIYAEVSTDCRFIDIPKRYITMEDFIEGKYSIEYLINPEYLDKDKNVGHIYVENTYQKIEITITIRRPILEDFVPARRVNDRHAIKINQVRLVNNYLEFCLDKLTLQEYVDKTRFALNNLVQYIPHSNIYKLGLMHMNILAGDIELVTQEFTRIDADSAGIVEGPMESCYYSYLKALLTKDEMLVDKAVSLIKQQIRISDDKLFYFWLLMYLDTEYSIDKTLLYKRIEELYASGMNSPIVYYEVCNIYNKQPLMLKHIDGLVISSLRWGYREKFISQEAIDIFIKLSLKEHNFNYSVFSLLREIYHISKNEECLFAISSMLVRGGKCDNEYHGYYRKSIELNQKIIGINENFIRSMDFSKYNVIPHSVLMYLNYKNSLNDKELAYLYANVVFNKSEYMNIYNEYVMNIESFMEKQIMKGTMSDDLSVIYGEYLEPQVVKTQFAPKIVNIIFKRKLICNNPYVKLVVVTHKELGREEQIPLVNGVAYVDVINDSAAIGLVDNKGNRYVSTIPYTLETLVDERVYIDICTKYSPDDYRLLLYLYSEIIDKVDNARAVNTCRTILETPEFNYQTKQKALLGIVDYYYNNYDKEILEKYLYRVDIDKIPADRGRDIIKYYIICGMYDNGFKAIEKFGYEDLSDEHIERIVEVLSEVEQFEGSETITAMCIYLYKKGRISDSVLRWLTIYYKGGIKDISKLWKKTYGSANKASELEENILAQMMFSDSYSDEIYDVFNAYYQGKKKGMVVKAFLKRTAYNYFIKEMKIPSHIFELLYNEIVSGNIDDDITIVALLYYFSRVKVASIYEEFINAEVRMFIDRGIVLPFFKEFSSFVLLPKDIGIKTYLIFKAEAKQKIEMEYSYGISPREIKNKTVERLREVIPGLYIKEFVIFHGEKLEYKILGDVDGVTSIEESDDIDMNMHSVQCKNRFELLNNLIINQEMKDDKKLLSSIDKYLSDVHLFEENLKIL